MFRRALVASVGAIALSGAALAADLPSYAPPPVYLPPPGLHLDRYLPRHQCRLPLGRFSDPIHRGRNGNNSRLHGRAE